MDINQKRARLCEAYDSLVEFLGQCNTSETGQVLEVNASVLSYKLDAVRDQVMNIAAHDQDGMQPLPLNRQVLNRYIP